MTYNVFSGTLNPAQSLNQSPSDSEKKEFPLRQLSDPGTRKCSVSQVHRAEHFSHILEVGLWIRVIVLMILLSAVSASFVGVCGVLKLAELRETVAKTCKA